MSGSIFDIDHLMVSVRDAQKAGETFERMGFTLTPRSRLPGMSNRLICFKPRHADRCNFIEFMGFDDRTLAPAMMSDILGQEEGPVSMVMVTADASATDRELRDQGLEPHPLLALKRDWELPSGEVISPQFTVSIPRIGVSPLFWNAVEYKTPEHYRRPEFTRHDNGAVQLVAVLGVSDRPQETARHYETVWGADISEEKDNVLLVAPGSVPLILMPPSVAAARFDDACIPSTRSGAAYLGFVVEVENLDTIDTRLTAGNIPFRRTPHGRLWVPPANAHGCAVEFREG